jgi:hypothetical protein
VYKLRKKFQVSLRVANNKRLYPGVFPTAIEAAHGKLPHKTLFWDIIIEHHSSLSKNDTSVQ